MSTAEGADQPPEMDEAESALDDPIDLALFASSERARRGENWLPEPYCVEVGRRLLLAELQFRKWVLRRVEKVQFEHERSVSRQISIEIAIRDDAPIFTGRDGQTIYLVPLSMMTRRTLVNLALTDEDDTRIPMLGLRLTQQLDESLLLAAAEADEAGSSSDPTLRTLVQHAIAGTAEEVAAAVKRFEDGSALPEHLQALCEPDSLFTATWKRLHRNFTFYVALDTADGSHRVLHMAFEEPTEWRIQRPALEDVPGGRGYEPLQKVTFGYWVQMAARLGITATRMRFQVPSAENAASYHFEASTPSGVRIIRASLLAGRPNEHRRPSVDHVVGHTPTVGLHAIEVPNVSLCRAQLDLRIPTRGWLATLVMSCAVITGVLAWVAAQWRSVPPEWTENQVTNVILLLVTASASGATLIAQRDFHGFGAYMVASLRMVGGLSLMLPIIEAASLVYGGTSPWRGGGSDLKFTIGLLFWVSVGLLALTLIAFTASAFAERTQAVEASPWDQSIQQGPRSIAARKRASVPRDNYDIAAGALGFASPAIGIRSAEGWHATYDWTDARQDAAITALTELPTRLPTRSTCPDQDDGSCPPARRCPLHRSTVLQRPARPVPNAPAAST